MLYYPKEINFEDLFQNLREKHKIEKVTIQSGGTLNAILIRKGLIDRISFVIAPALIGGKNTATLVDGRSLNSEKDLEQIKALKLRKCEKLKNSYLLLEYDVVNKS